MHGFFTQTISWEISICRISLQNFAESCQESYPEILQRNNADNKISSLRNPTIFFFFFVCVCVFSKIWRENIKMGSCHKQIRNMTLCYAIVCIGQSHNSMPLSIAPVFRWVFMKNRNLRKLTDRTQTKQKRDRFRQNNCFIQILITMIEHRKHNLLERNRLGAWNRT